MADQPRVTRRKLTDYVPDPHNANKGSERGQYMLDESVSQVGAHRSLVATADDMIPIGNHTLQALVDAGITDVIEIETDGQAAVVVKRKDWASVDDPTVRKAAYFDNRTAEVSLNWDADQILLDMDNGVELESMFHEDELSALTQQALADEVAQHSALDDVTDYAAEADAIARRENTGVFPLAIVLSAADRRRWRTIKDEVGYKDDTRAFLALLDALEGAADA